MPDGMIPSTRRLAAILSADACGFTTHVARDEMATRAALAIARQVIRRAVERAHGRIVDAVGDNLLAVFPSVVDAVQAGVEAQQRLAGVGCGLRFRIGIAVGDLALDGGSVFGDAIALAARVQALAPPGGVAVSAIVAELVGSKLPVSFHGHGSHRLKNVAAPHRVCLVRPATAVGAGRATGWLAALRPLRWHEAGAAVVIALLMALLVLVLDLHAELGTLAP